MDKAKTKISALLITFNEEDNIEAVLDNINFADEIIVVDSFSTDNTVTLIKKHPHVKLIQREFTNYTDQKKFTMEQATHDWILFLDADERITPGLKEEILEVTQNDASASAYYFLRTFMFKKEILRFSGWQSDKNYRLFKKSKVHFTEDRIVHETLVVDGQSLTLKNKLLHYSFKNHHDYKGKMFKYGRMKAQEEFLKGKKARWYHFIFRPTYKFLNHYVMRLGFLDGKKGITICYLNALGVLERYRELKRLHNQKSH
ncbi:glycosyltransferase family 2 protein [Croceitalea sp. MTPC5]|uniref:glycosyltransferase family 2 protein n=1 Tax=Croceitalea sp. MTPC5 TaxID=3056565 RepID=UPI002B38E9AA|nr:glycosyltransferase family 2 protein [Croceitalea sp. MTPC5]